jgi:hypothetical protein
MKGRYRASMIPGIVAASLMLAACVSSGPASPPAPARRPNAVDPKPRAEFPGFRRVLRKDTEYFCQSRTPTGSRTRTGEQCFTRDEMMQMEENSRDFFKDAGGGSSHDTMKMDSPR